VNFVHSNLDVTHSRGSTISEKIQNLAFYLLFDRRFDRWKRRVSFD